MGFLALGALRSADLAPHAALAPAAAASVLTIVSMAALGLVTGLRAVARAGAHVVAAVTLSLLALGGISLGQIRLLGGACPCVGRSGRIDDRELRLGRPAAMAFAVAQHVGAPVPKRHADLMKQGRVQAGAAAAEITVAPISASTAWPADPLDGSSS